jgi:hypothetical protein
MTAIPAHAAFVVPIRPHLGKGSLEMCGATGTEQP